MNTFVWIAFICYLAIWCVAGYFLWRAYRVWVKKDFCSIKITNGEPLENPHLIARPFAIMELLTGIALMLLLIAVPIFAIPISIWPAFLVIIGTTRHQRIIKFAKQNEPISSVTGKGLEHKLDDTETKLLGWGFGGILGFGIVVVWSMLNDPLPSIASLQPFSGQLVEQHISEDRSTIYADIRVRNGPQDVILFQRVSKQLSGDIQKLPSGSAVTALIAPKTFTDSRTGLNRHKMWQLAINQQELFSYEGITQFIDRKDAAIRMLGYVFSAVGIACFVAAGLRRFWQVRA